MFMVWFLLAEVQCGGPFGRLQVSDTGAVVLTTLNTGPCDMTPLRHCTLNAEICYPYISC